MGLLKAIFAGIIGRLIKRVLLLVLVLTMLWVILLRFFPAAITPRMVQRLWGNPESMEYGFQRKWYPIEAYGASVPKAAIASQDPGFTRHYGFHLWDSDGANFPADSLRRVLDQGTISWQAAEQTFLWRGQSLTWLKTGLAAYFTGLIELTWPKQRTLVVYLNTLEPRPGVFGVGTWCRIKLQKRPSELSGRKAVQMITDSATRQEAQSDKLNWEHYQSTVLDRMQQLKPQQFATLLPKTN
jgi:monofunctional biosynthetic peptidoglycan transglycosylase